MKKHRWLAGMVTWLKFNLVGGIGIGVQLGALAGLKSGLRLGYVLATALAVEIAVIHNFVWHERFTWAHRRGRILRRFVWFNLTTGALPIAGNLLAMKMLVGFLGWPYLTANGIAIVACSILNFLVSDRLVFRAESDINPCAPAVRPTRYLPDSSRRDRRAPSSRKPGAERRRQQFHKLLSW